MLILYFLIFLDTTVVYFGGSLFYDFEGNKIFLTDGARVYYTDVKVLSDSIVFNIETNDVHSYKNSILYVGGDTIYGGAMAYNLNTRKGVVLDGSGTVEKGWFEGDEMRLVAERTLNIESGRFTTCEHEHPCYHFWADQLKVFVDDMVYARPVVLYIRDIPVFILPFWFFPIKRERSSGLLHPRIGRDAFLGRYVRNIAYYWVISDYADLTVGLDYMENKGLALNLEGLWLYRPSLSGNLNMQYVDEKGGRRRWSVRGVHRHNLMDGTVVKGRADFVSDLDFNRDFGEDVIRELDQVLSSFLSVSRRFGPISSSLVIRETRDLKRDKTRGDYPKIRTSVSRELFGGRLSYSGLLRNSITGKERRRESHNNLRFTLQRRLWHFNLSPQLGMRFNITDREEISLERTEQGSINIGTVLYGRTVMGGPQIWHTASPGFHYGFSRTEGFYTRSMGASLRNDFQLVFWDGRRFNLGWANISARWNFEESKWNPLGFTVGSSPFRQLSIRGSWMFDPYQGRVYDKSLITSWTFSHKDFRAKLTYNMREGRDQSIWGSLGMNLTKGWSLKGGARYNIRERELISEHITLIRDLCCWELMFTHQRYGERWSYDFRVQIKAIPEVKVGKDIIRMLIGD